jgi:FAD/FMN-containing dehydrogenase
MDSELRGRLVEVVGKAGVDPSGSVVSPADAAQVAAVCALCRQTRTRIAVTSSAATAADASGGEEITISLHRMTGITVDPGSLTARAEAGALVSALRSAVDARGLALATPAADGATHTGSLVARGGIARRGLCGIEAVLPGGDQVHAGGRMPKDVSGYDLCAALLGSHGRLGLVVAATFRLVPAGARVIAHDAPGVTAPGQPGELIRSAFDPEHLLVEA